MSTQLIELEGIASWAKVFENNRDMNKDYHGEGGAYTIDVQLEKEELDKLTKSGSRLKPKLKDEGIVVGFKRKHINEVIAEFGGAPKVVGPDKEPLDKHIGNGSRVKVYVSVYDTKLGKGTRLEGVHVLDLVEYEGSGEGGVQLPF